MSYKSTGLAHTVVVGFMLSFVGAKGCWGFGGNVSLGDDEGGSSGQASGTAGKAGGGSASAGNGGSDGVDTGGAGKAGSDGVNTGGAGKAGSDGVDTGGAGKAGSDGVNTGVAGGTSTDVPLTVSASGHVSSSKAFGVAGSFYSASDGVSADGANLNGGDCELAGHTPADCSAVTAPVYSAPGVIDWGKSGMLCTSGTVARVLDLTTTPGTPDYASMWGSAIGFDLQEDKGQAAPYNASENGVIGIAFDINAVPLTGIRVEFLTQAVQNEPAAWKATGSSFVSPLVPGHNVLLFQDVKPLPFFDVKTAFDPTQLLAVQFHIPTTTSYSAAYSYCVSNVSLVLNTVK